MAQSERSQIRANLARNRRQAASARLLIEQLQAIERGEAPIAPRAAATAAASAAAGAHGSPRRTSRPWPLHLALGALLLATIFGLGGGARIAPNAAGVRLRVVSFARAADGRLEVVTQAPSARAGVPLIPGADRIERPGRPTRIAISELGIDAPITEAGLVLRGTVPTWEVVPNAVAHYDGSAAPGENGNVVLAGHLNTPLSNQGAVFRRLPQARIGQVIEVWSGDTRHAYTVDSVKVVDPRQTEVMAPTTTPKLTLITCYPDLKFSERLVVTATYAPGA